MRFVRTKARRGRGGAAKGRNREATKHRKRDTAPRRKRATIKGMVNGRPFAPDPSPLPRLRAKMLPLPMKEFEESSDSLLRFRAGGGYRILRRPQMFDSEE